MQDVLADLTRQGLALPRAERSQLVDLLLGSLNEESLADIEAAWDEEAEERLVAFDRGEHAAVDGEAVLARAHALAHR